MIIRQLQEIPEPALTVALAEFERQFRYPLGKDGWFRISHGEDYTRFFRSLSSESACWAAQEESTGEVLGVLSAARRTLRAPDGSSEEVVYLCDLKVSPQARGSRVLLRLFKAAEAWNAGRCRKAFAVVMGGTVATPERYAGRVGIPALEPIAQVTILRIPVNTAPTVAAADRATEDEVRTAFQALSLNRFATPAGVAAIRSQRPLVPLLLSDGSGCGLVEDTLRGKRLFRDSGEEMRSGHLSCLAYASAESAADMILAACECCATQTEFQEPLPALFAAAPSDEAEAILAAIHARRPAAAGADEVILAPATIYGHGLQAGFPWMINTSEV
ncbi:MAG: hypothetical protein N2C14_00715 [Planctomycetales bacterium]